MSNTARRPILQWPYAAFLLAVWASTLWASDERLAEALFDNGEVVFTALTRLAWITVWLFYPAWLLVSFGPEPTEGETWPPHDMSVLGVLIGTVAAHWLGGRYLLPPLLAWRGPPTTVGVLLGVDALSLLLKGEVLILTFIALLLSPARRRLSSAGFWGVVVGVLIAPPYLMALGFFLNVTYLLWAALPCLGRVALAVLPIVIARGEMNRGQWPWLAIGSVVAFLLYTFLQWVGQQEAVKPVTAPVESPPEPAPAPLIAPPAAPLRPATMAEPWATPPPLPPSEAIEAPSLDEIFDLAAEIMRADPELAQEVRQELAQEFSAADLEQSAGVFAGQPAMQEVLGFAPAPPAQRAREVDLAQGMKSIADPQGSASMISHLEAALHVESEEVQRTAILALGDLGGEERVATLRGLLAEAQPTLRLAIIDALGRIGGDAAVTALTDLVADGDHAVRWHAQEVVAQLRAGRTLPRRRHGRIAEKEPLVTVLG